MPKKLDELRTISQGEREKAVIEAVGKIGLASIEDVVNSLAMRFELNLSAENTYKAFSKTIGTDLKRLAGNTLSIAYFTRHADHPTQVSEDDLKTNPEGEVKNIYNKKYFISTSDSGVPGAHFFSDSNGLFVPIHDSAGELTVKWSITAINSYRANHVQLVFGAYSGNCFCVNIPLDTLPCKILIARASKDFTPDQEFLRRTLGDKSAMILWNDHTISAQKKGDRLGHVLLEFEKGGSSVILTDFHSTNGSLVGDLSANQTQGLSKARTDVVLPPDYGQDSGIWKKIKGSPANEISDDPTRSIVIKNNQMPTQKTEENSIARIPFKLKLGNTTIHVTKK